jgi:hypothetical protein
VGKYVREIINIFTQGAIYWPAITGPEKSERARKSGQRSGRD